MLLEGLGMDRYVQYREWSTLIESAKSIFPEWWRHLRPCHFFPREVYHALHCTPSFLR